MPFFSKKSSKKAAKQQQQPSGDGGDAGAKSVSFGGITVSDAAPINASDTMARARQKQREAEAAAQQREQEAAAKAARDAAALEAKIAANEARQKAEREQQAADAAAWEAKIKAVRNPADITVRSNVAQKSFFLFSFFFDYLLLCPLGCHALNKKTQLAAPCVWAQRPNIRAPTKHRQMQDTQARCHVAAYAEKQYSASAHLSHDSLHCTAAKQLRKRRQKNFFFSPLFFSFLRW